MLNYFKTPPDRRIHARIMWAAGAAALCFLVLFAVFYAAIGAEAASVSGTDAADRWEAEDSAYPYAQLAAYFDTNSAFSLDNVYLRRMNITKSLEENAVTVPDGASPYIDAFSAETTLSVTTSRATISTSAVVCGGDFFFFHPVELLHGGYFDEDDLTSRSVVLDEYAAWQLFGAIEVAGMEVTIGGQPFRVAGVCRTPTDETDLLAWGEKPRIFVNYIGLRLTNGFDRATCYEIVLPNPINGFAAKLVSGEYNIGEFSTDAVLYDYTARFTFETLAGQAPDFFLRAMRRDRVVPPFWENVARVAETRAIVLAFFGAIAGILALLAAVVFASLWFVIHPIRIRSIYGFFEDRWEARRMKAWLKKQASPLNAEEKKRPETVDPT